MLHGHVHPEVILLAAGFDDGPRPEQAAMVPMISREVIEHRHTGWRIDGKDVTAALAIFGCALAGLHTVVVNQCRLAALTQLHAALSEVLPRERLCAENGQRHK